MAVDLTPTEIRLQALEMMMEHVLTVMAVHMPPDRSEHLKKTLLDHGTKIDRSSLAGPTDQAQIEANEMLLRFRVRRMLLRVEEDERALRRQQNLPDVHPLVSLSQE